MPDTKSGEGRLDLIAEQEQETPAQEVKQGYDPERNIIPAGFDYQQLEEVKKLIEEEVDLIETEYTAENYREKIEDCKSNFEAVQILHPTTPNGGYDIRIPFQKMLVELLVCRAKRQTFSADPLVLLEQEDEINPDDLVARENRLDFDLRKHIRYEEVNDAVYTHGIYMPVAITKTIECYEEEEITTIQSYEPSPEDIERFVSDFASQLLDAQSIEFQKWQELMSGGKVRLPVTENKVLYSGPKVYRVDADRFLARPKIKDFRKQRVHGEQIDYTWADIEARLNNPHYGWDAEAVERVKQSYGDDYKRVAIPFYEMIVLYAKDGKTHKRYIVTMEVKSREIVKSILYTREDLPYTAHSVNPKDDSWIGESMLPMINDLVNMFCSNFNFLAYSNDLSHTPVILSTDPKVITRRAIDLGVVNVLPFEKDTEFMPVKLGEAGWDRLQFLQMLRELMALLSGVDPSMLSGAETPGDPSAPAAKTAMKMQVTNMRIEDKIVKLQYADAQVCAKVERIRYSMTDDLNYWNKGKQAKVNRSAYNVPVRYVMHGSRMTFSREMELNAAMKFLEILTRFYPATWQSDYNVQRSMLNTIINGIGGTILKNKDIYTAGTDAYIEMQDKIKELKQAMKGKGGAQGQSPQAGGQPDISQGMGVQGGMSSPGSDMSGSAEGIGVK